MLRPLNDQSRTRRQGAVLLIVLAMLLLFSVVGLAFVFYSQSRSDVARASREAENTRALAPDVPPEILLGEFLRQFIYDVNDDPPGQTSALRGLSLGRTMYGWKDSALYSNTAAFNGVGRVHKTQGYGTGPLFTADDYYMVNYMYFQADGFIRDPERFALRAVNDPLRDPTNFSLRGPYAVGANAPYTYPDLNSMFLAAVKADGTVLLPSYFRPWTKDGSGLEFGPLDGGNPNWTNTTNKALKYMVLRPRPADMGAGFPSPGPQGDVKNLIGAPGDADSIWIDLGSAIHYMADGRKYKVLFAPLIVDLDNRVNVNAHGNIVAAGQVHTSNKSGGPWEVNLARVITSGNEARNLIVGNSAATGKYGANVIPTGAAADVLADVFAPFYSNVDFDSYNKTAGAVSGPLLLPTVNPLLCFPSYDASYGNMSTGAADTECRNHPSLFNIFQPAGDDRVFNISNMQALLRDASSDTDLAYSDLGRLCPVNFNFAADPDTSVTYEMSRLRAQRLRRLVTTLSFDVDQPGVTPWAWDPANTTYQYTLPTNELYPSGSLTPFPSDTGYAGGAVAVGAAPPANSEFAAVNDWRAASAYQGRLDLNRALPDYPVPDAVTMRITNTAAYNAALAARQQLAADIFQRMWKATGAANPATTAAGVQYDALRWLAQLSVNMVDSIDADDYMTPFNWKPGDATAWVYGTELPRLVLNEVLAEVANDPSDPLTGGLATLPYNVNFWIELHNPLKTDAALSYSGEARLQVPVDGANPLYPVYKIVITDRPNANMRLAGNVLGDPDAYDAMTMKRLEVADFTPEVAPTEQPLLAANEYNHVHPANGNYFGPDRGNEGFYLLGPKYDLPGTNVNRPKATLRLKDYTPTNFNPSTLKSALSYQVPVANNAATTTLINDFATNPAKRPTILLRRLVCPNLPPQLDPAQPFFNPYVTTDYLENIQVRNGLTADNEGARTPPLVATRASTGRRQPYAAHVTQQKDQKPATLLTDQPQHTFFRHNAQEAPPDLNDPAATPVFNATADQTLKAPFDWLAFLDRKLISPMELLFVSGFKPHELTQQFMLDTGSFKHLAPWFDDNMRLYRALEFLETRNRSAGVALGERIPAKINLNTIWDKETFRALCDPQNGNSNSFDLAAVDALFDALMAQRTPGGAPGPNDKPFVSLAAAISPSDAAGQYPTGTGINDRILRSASGGGPGTARLLENATLPANTHPSLKHQLLNKIYNNTTTRSHCYAVWLTTGFFEVVDDSTRPYKLGAEIGAATGQNVRHHMFAVVDRSALAIPGNRPLANFTTVIAASTTVTVTPSDPAAMDVIRRGTYVNVSTTSGTAVTAGTTVPITPVSMNNIRAPYLAYNPHKAANELWSMALTVDAGAAQEVVSVTAATATTFTATFNKAHAVGAPIFFAGTIPGAYLTVDRSYVSGSTVYNHEETVFAVPDSPTTISATFSKAHNVAAAPARASIPIYPSRFKVPGKLLADALIPSSGEVFGLGTATVTIDFNAYGTTPAALVDNVKAAFATIRPGSLLTLEDGLYQETVIVKDVSATGFTASFTKDHRLREKKPAAPTDYVGYYIYTNVPGNPGPQPHFLPRDNGVVVPYYTVID